MSDKQKIEPKVILTIYTKTIGIVHFIVKDNDNNILFLDNILYNPLWQSSIQLRKQVVEKVLEIMQNYEIDTILIEETKLFTNGISIYPDPEVYKNILYCYGIQVSVEDRFIPLLPYILVIPYKEWTETILNTRQKYLLDKCKDHILVTTKLTDEQNELVKQYDFYQALCFSDCIKYDKLINKKYLRK